MPTVRRRPQRRDEQPGQGLQCEPVVHRKAGRLGRCRRTVGGASHCLSMSNVVRVVVADRHPIVRYGLLALLSTVDSISVVADVGNGEAAMRAVTAHRPDVLLVELSELHAVTVIPGTALIVFTSRDDDQSLRAAIKAGAHGYVLK